MASIYIYGFHIYTYGFPGGTSGKELACQCRRPKTYRFHPWIGKIPQRRAWQPTPVLLPREFHGQRCLPGRLESIYMFLCYALGLCWLFTLYRVACVC